MAEEKAVPTLDQIKGVMVEAVDAKVAPLAAAVEAIDEKIKSAVDGVKTELDAKISALGEKPDGYVDMDGKPFSPRGKGGAPAHVKEFGDRPLMLADVLRFFSEKDEKAVPLLTHVSTELQKFGHKKTQGNRSVMFPLTPSCIPDVDQSADSLRKLLADAMPITEDFSVAAPLWKANAHRMISKQMDPNDDALGGSLIPLPPTGDLIQLFRATTVMGKVGAEQITLPPQGSIRWPRETGTSTFYWLDSNDTITASTVATGSLQLTAHRLGGLITVPNDLVRYGVNIEGLLRRSLVLDAGLAEDLAFLEGEGGGTKPLGLIRFGRSANDTPTADSVTLHNAQTTASAGDTFGPEDPLEMIGLIETANDPEGPTAFVMRPMMFVALGNRRIDQGGGSGTGDFVFKDMHMLDGAIRKQLRGLPVVTSTQVNKTSRKGAGTTLTYILCLNGRRIVIGRVGTVELAVSEHSQFTTDSIQIRAILRTSMGLKKPESVVVTPTLLES